MLWKHLGGAKRMGEKCNTITLYASQADPVIEAIERNGVCYSKEAYVRKKYQESAKIFTTAYSWFVREMEKYVKKPDGAEYPYWAFREAYNVDQSMGGNFLTLEVPLDEVLLFDMYDWNKILCLKYIGEDEKDEKQFQEQLEMYGIREMDVVLSNFYPLQKQQILKSWQRLTRYHEELVHGNTELVRDVQAGLWRIKKEWSREMKVLVYRKCSTCQKALKWLEAHGIAFEERAIVEENPTYEELKEWHAMSGVPLKKFFNTSGMLYKQMQLKDKLPTMTEDEQIKLLATDGMLVKRPFVVGDRFVLTGFKEKEWEEKLLK